jgi:hypothetical protein
MIERTAPESEIQSARTPLPHTTCLMPPRSDLVTRSPFERRHTAGQHDLAFKVAFASNYAAARSLRVSRMTIWRWRHDRAPLPNWVADVLTHLVQSKVAEAHEAQQQLRYLLSLPPRPPRPLSGCCAGRGRR